MRFWDSSAIVPLLVEEERTLDARRLLSEDQSILASHLTPSRYQVRSGGGVTLTS